jgi:hypothetical protein
MEEPTEIPENDDSRSLKKGLGNIKTNQKH